MNKKNIIILIVVVVIFAFAGFYLSNQNNSSGSALVVGSKTQQSNGAEQIFVSLQKMAKVKLDDSIFSNQVFINLKDNSIEVLPQETRGSNPFTPISSAVVKDIILKK